VDKEENLFSIISNYLDVFSWVVMWKPIERLIFYWNPFLKELSILNKMINADAIVLENEEEFLFEEDEPAGKSTDVRYINPLSKVN
jgi:hypothetical protein